ncbi:MAG: hypothetical protein ACP5H7_01455 [Minisyncoccia bacterium]
MKTPFYSFLYLGMCTLFFYFTLRFKNLYLSSKSVLAIYFRNIAFFSSIAFLIYALMGIFSNNPFWLGIGNIIGELFFLIAFIYLIASFFYLFYPNVNRKNIIFFGFILVAISVLIHIYFFPRPFIDSKGILHFQAPLVPGLIFVFFSFCALGPMIILFLKEAILNKKIRKRSLFIALSLFLFLSRSVFQSLFESNFPLYVTSFILQMLGAFSLLFGFIIKIKEEK